MLDHVDIVDVGLSDFPSFRDRPCCQAPCHPPGSCKDATDGTMQAGSEPASSLAAVVLESALRPPGIAAVVGGLSRDGREQGQGNKCGGDKGLHDHLLTLIVLLRLAMARQHDGDTDE